MTTNGNGAANIEHLVKAANDALTDDMVTRIAQTAADGMDLVDQVNRSGLKRALPALAALVENGDLDRLVRLARVYGSAEDALTDDMISRLAETVGEGLSTLDRFNRGGAAKVIDLLERLDASGSLDKLAEALPRLCNRVDQIEGLLVALEDGQKAAREQLPSAGNVGGMFKLLSNPDNQDALRYLVGLGKALKNAGQVDR